MNTKEWLIDYLLGMGYRGLKAVMILHEKDLLSVQIIRAGSGFGSENLPGPPRLNSGLYRFPKSRLCSTCETWNRPWEASSSEPMAGLGLAYRGRG